MSKTILLIDDEKEAVGLMRKKMQSAGYDVHVAYNGKEGLEAAQHLHPHLILSDIAMPDMDGIAFYNQLKSLQEISHIPVIFATAHGTNEDKLRGQGAKDFLIKPFDGQTMIERVEAFFKSQKVYKVMIATRLLYLTKSILNVTNDIARELDIQLTIDQRHVVDEAVKFKPDLLILDVDMFIAPSAAEVTKILRSQDELRETRILVIRSMMVDLTSAGSLNSNQAIVEQCLANGASHYAGHLNRESFLSIAQEYCR